MGKANSVKQFDEAVKNEVVKSHIKGGTTVKELSERYGVSKVSIYRWIKEYHECEDKRAGKPYAEEFKTNIAKLHVDDRVSLNALAEEYNVSRASILTWCQTYRAAKGSGSKAVSQELVNEFQQRIAKLENENRFQKRMIDYLIKELAKEV